MSEYNAFPDRKRRFIPFCWIKGFTRFFNNFSLPLNNTNFIPIKLLKFSKMSVISNSKLKDDIN